MNDWEVITLDIHSFSPTFQIAVRKEQERREEQERMIEEIGKKMKEKMKRGVVTNGEIQRVSEEVREEMELVRQDLIFVEIGNRKPEERVKKEYEMSEESEETEIEEF